MLNSLYKKIPHIILALTLLLSFTVWFAPSSSYAKHKDGHGSGEQDKPKGDDKPKEDDPNKLSEEDKKNGYTSICGKDDSAVKVKFDFGCVGDELPEGMENPIYDLAFALIRFLSAGVGVVVVIFIIIAGIKYSAAEGNPEATQQAKQGIQSALTALIIYIFIFAIVQYLVPGGVFK